MGFNLTNLQPEKAGQYSCEIVLNNQEENYNRRMWDISFNHTGQKVQDPEIKEAPNSHAVVGYDLILQCKNPKNSHQEMSFSWPVPRQQRLEVSDKATDVYLNMTCSSAVYKNSKSNNPATEHLVRSSSKKNDDLLMGGNCDSNSSPVDPLESDSMTLKEPKTLTDNIVGAKEYTSEDAMVVETHGNLGDSQNLSEKPQKSSDYVNIQNMNKK
ncbi:uncharacterized protein LOC121872607 [Homarus americanus]|nr:uncharacterized protein LOC121872607 [Homarus americanus]XP_042231416.1 uncharacterized protein LOC121872607 [Homarus americanus]XP_042231426.1 uncharacterized protein LOC121872607 [Homarus americanus]